MVSDPFQLEKTAIVQAVLEESRWGKDRDGYRDYVPGMPMRQARSAIARDAWPIGSKVYGRRGTRFARSAGTVIGGYTWCQMEGCRGVRVWVRWKDGRVTKPCSKGLVLDRQAWRIG